MMHNQKGLVSLLAVSLTSLLVLIVTVAMTTMMVGELRQSIDSENSVKAYYLAESGAEEAYATIKQELGPTGAGTVANQDCNANQSPGDVVHGSIPVATSGQNARITCRVIQSSGTNVVGKAQQDSAAVISFFKASLPNPDDISFSWDNATSTHTITPSFPNMTATGPGFPSVDPPPVELTLIDANQLDVTNSDIREVILVPCNTDNGATTVTLGNQTKVCPHPSATPLAFDSYAYTPSNPASPSAPGAALIPVNCPTVGHTYRCSVTLDSLSQTSVVPNPAFVVLVKPLYSDMSYDLSASSIFGPVNIPFVNALVDVTARSGNSFRRIQESVPIKSQPSSGLDYVLFGNYSICKDLTLLVSPTGPPSVKLVGGVNPGDPQCDVNDALTPNVDGAFQ